MFLLYNLILLIVMTLLSPLIFYKLATDRRYRIGLAERFGFISEDVVYRLGEKPIWFHAASVGEVIAAVPLLEGMRKDWPGRKLVVSTFTPTGRETAVSKLMDIQTPIADAVIFLPLDLPLVASRVIRRLSPSILILMETELWPNLIGNAAMRDIPVVIVNGRISDGSYGKYWAVRPLFKKVFDAISGFLMQSDADAERIKSLGAEGSKIRVTGNIKFDLKARDEEIPFMTGSVGPWFIAGSTHSGEEGPLIDIYSKLRRTLPSLRLLIAPRHIERIGEVESLLREKGVGYARRSLVREAVVEPVLLLDTLGELAAFYKYGDVVFIGGSLVPVGGHNMLEPALYGRPVLFGPHTHNFRDAAKAVINSGGGVRVNDEKDLETRLDRLLSDNELRVSMGRRAMEAVSVNRGAVARTLASLSPYFNDILH